MHGEQMEVVAELTPTPLRHMGMIVGATHRFRRTFGCSSGRGGWKAWEGIGQKRAILGFCS